MTKYSRQDRKGLEQPPEGVHQMNVAFEQPSKNNKSLHSFLLKNEQYQIWYSCFLSRTEEFAQSCGVHVDDDGTLDLSKTIGKPLQITVQKTYDKHGEVFMKIVQIDSSNRAPEEFPDIPL